MKALVIVFVILLSGCVSNAPFRTADGVCSGHWWGCGKYYEENPGYDLGFIEFTERGNDFSPKQTAELLSRISEKSKKDDIAVIVFIHGWKHNASTEDENVISFKKALDFIARSKATGNKKIVGIYIGWRGLSFHGLQLENGTFWDRKAVAEEVGRGGVTEFLSDLEYIAGQKKTNFMLTIGHSFGAAITLSALHDTLLEKMKTAERGGNLKSFGDGVVLLNPAIEANQALLLKESSMRLGSKGKPTKEEPVPSVMYVVSSRADWPTNSVFPKGQYLGMALRWKQEDIKRDYFGFSYTIKESQLDTETVGNYSWFTTGYMEDVIIDPAATGASKPKSLYGQGPSIGVSTIKVPNSKLGQWGFKSYCSPKESGYGVNQFPCFDDDPIDFISAPESFIEGHNDVFNRNVIALLSTIVRKSLSEKQRSKPEYCYTGEDFDFGKCYVHYFEYNKSIKYLKQ